MNGGRNGGGGKPIIGEPGDSKCIGDGAFTSLGSRPSMLPGPVCVCEKK